MKKYQTITDFMVAPFNNPDSMEKDNKYRDMYNKFVQNRAIYIKGICEIEGSYYYLIRVPSDSNDGKLEYDVVIRFFTDSNEVRTQPHLRNYHIQFFSNSPGFIYKYAYLYNSKGYLIDILASKLNKEAISKPPEKSNANMELSYDKTIYFACMYLSTGKFAYLNKGGTVAFKKVSPDKLFSQINDFNSVRIENEILNEEKKLKKELKEDLHRKLSTKSTISNGTKTLTFIKVKPGGRKMKIVAKKSTRRT